ncbi:hypothetical protein BBJ28_00007427 [Nothophytophthora sp. Chile5]|nr:hypothetical protein BBJ28_00007427 [Nothophytophthora sp. Chile5]
MAATGASRASEFVVPGFGGRISGAIATAEKHCKQMRESGDMCGHVCERLKAIVDDKRLGPANLLPKFGDTLAAFVKFLQKRTESSFIKRLASNRKVEEELLNFHEDLDELETLLAGDSGSPATQVWRQQWTEDRHNKLEKLQSIAGTAQVLHSEKSSPGFVEGLFMLKYELDHKASDYSIDMDGREYLALMERVVNRFTRLSNVTLPTIPEWFIPRDDALFDVQDFFDCGSYGSVHRGTWRKGASRGKDAQVVIKCLLVDDDEAKESFLKETQVWHRLDHPHVVKLYGACHVGTPAFFVCEDATRGNFVNYFQRDRSSLWRLFYEAALGLDFLHEEKVVHGDLKCNNILVGSDGKAKICDFGFSFIRSQSVGLSAKPQPATIRWKAQECLKPVSGKPDPQFNPRFASDVFSFGMCIIEAFLGEPPYGLDDDDTVLDHIFNHHPYPRPDGMEDDEWELVQQMCHWEWEERIKLVDVIDKLETFADRETRGNQRQEATPATRKCPDCTTDIPGDYKFCGKCGLQLDKELATFG